MSHNRYEAAVSIIKEAVQDNANITGAVRLAWPNLGPLVEARYISAQKIAEKTGVSAPTLRSAIRKVASEHGHPQRRKKAPNIPSDSKNPAKPDTPSSPGVRIVHGEPKTEPDNRPEPDADGLIDLGDGRRYRRKPNNPRFFEIFEDDSPNPVSITDVRPTPLKRK